MKKWFNKVKKYIFIDIRKVWEKIKFMYIEDPTKKQVLLLGVVNAALIGLVCFLAYVVLK